jgi:hypothetical protein
MRPKRAIAPSPRRATPGSSIRDIPRIIGTTFFWCLLDALRTPRAPKRTVYRLTAR